MGCLAYALLGHKPMIEREVKQYSKGMRRLPVDHLKSNNVSDQAIKFLQALLVPTPTDRLTAHMALQDPWLRQRHPSGHPDLSVFSTTDDERALQWLYRTGFGRHGMSLSGAEALYWAVSNGHDFIVDFLTRNNVDVNILNSREARMTAMHLAAKAGDCNAIRYLLQMKASDSMESRQGWRAIHFAAAHGHENAVFLLLELGTRLDGNVNVDVSTSIARKTALHLAASSGHVGVTRLLLLQGAKCDVSCSSKETPLHGASRGGHVQVGAWLLQAGAKVNTRCSSGKSPLLYAVNQGQEEMAQFLIEHGADIYLKDIMGVSPLSRADELGDRAMKDILRICRGRQVQQAKNMSASKAISSGKSPAAISRTRFSNLRRVLKPKIIGRFAASNPDTTPARGNDSDILSRSEPNLVEDNEVYEYYLGNVSSTTGGESHQQVPTPKTPRLRSIPEPQRVYLMKPRRLVYLLKRRKLRPRYEGRENAVEELTEVNKQHLSTLPEQPELETDGKFFVISGSLWPSPTIKEVVRPSRKPRMNPQPVRLSEDFHELMDRPYIRRLKPLAESSFQSRVPNK